MARNFRRKEIKKREPNELQPIMCRVPAFLLSEVKEYGDTGRIITAALLRSHRGKYTYDLREILSLIQKNIESLEMWKDNGPAIDEGEIDQHHIQMLEMYKAIYHMIKGSRLLRKKPEKKEE